MQFHMMTLLGVQGKIAWVILDCLSQGKTSDILIQCARTYCLIARLSSKTKFSTCLAFVGRTTAGFCRAAARHVRLLQGCCDECMCSEFAPMHLSWECRKISRDWSPCMRNYLAVLMQDAKTSVTAETVRRATFMCVNAT